METFIEAKAFVAHPRYAHDRSRVLAALDPGSLDEPIRDIISGFARRSYCFPLQSCYGHFICTAGQASRTFDPVPDGYEGMVRYRIAYIALCIQNSREGRTLRAALEEVPELSPDYIQFGSAGWFWERCVNTYVLQVEPIRHKEKDEVRLDADEAMHIKHVRDVFFMNLKNLLGRHIMGTADRER